MCHVKCVPRSLYDLRSVSIPAGGLALFFSYSQSGKNILSLSSAACILMRPNGHFSILTRCTGEKYPWENKIDDRGQLDRGACTRIKLNRKRPRSWVNRPDFTEFNRMKRSIKRNKRTILSVFHFDTGNEDLTTVREGSLFFSSSCSYSLTTIKRERNLFILTVAGLFLFSRHLHLPINIVRW